MVGMITNISDRKDTSFLSIDKALFNRIMFSLLNNKVFSCILNSIFMSLGALCRLAQTALKDQMVCQAILAHHLNLYAQNKPFSICYA